MKSPKSSGKPKRHKPLIMRRVVGQSMSPTFSDGQIVLASGLFSAYNVDDVIVVMHDNIEKIKRIKKLDGDKLFVVGDNSSASTDSRDFGWISTKDILAKVVWY